jgi:hypothetical protein
MPFCVYVRIGAFETEDVKDLNALIRLGKEFFKIRDSQLRGGATSR